MNTEQPEQSPYVEDKVVTWKTMSRAGRVAVSAGILAVGAFTVAGPAMPVMAQFLGFTSPQRPTGENLAGNFGGQTPGQPGSNPSGAGGNAIGPTGGDPFANGQVPVVDGVNPNVVPLPASVVAPGAIASNGSQQKIKLPPVSANFGNTGSATPSVGGNTTGYGGKIGGREGREGYDDRDGDNEREGSDD
ncbi:MAG: hypothetical protein KGL77_06475 [Actinomycetales bacterium]|nr:hypothetical protein [Actinomycetales bacterium]